MDFDSISDEAKNLFNELAGTFESRTDAFKMFSDTLKNTDRAISGDFFMEASNSVDAFSILDNEGIADFLVIPETKFFLKLISASIFVNAAEAFVRLRDGRELPGAQGLMGAALDSAILRFEQGGIQKILGAFAPKGSARRERIVQDIGGFSTGSTAFFRGYFAAPELEKAINKTGSFRFDNINKRIELGENVLSEIRKHNDT